MCPSVSVFTRKSAERDTFAHICLTNEISDRTRMSSVIIMQRVQSKLIRLQVRHTQFGTVGVRELDLEEPVVSNEDDVVMCCRIKFVGGVLRDSGISTDMESWKREINKGHAPGLYERTHTLTATCMSPCRAAPRGPFPVPVEH